MGEETAIAPEPAARLPRAKGHTVVISQDVIDAAVRGDSGHCMIADAIKAQVPGVANVAVDLATIRFSDRKVGARFTYLTPAAAQTALVEFDHGIDPDPFSFRLRPSEAHTVATRRVTAQATDDAPKKQRATGKRRVRDVGEGKVAQREGGKPAPVAVLAHDPKHGRIRRFGVRQLRSRVPVGE